MKLHLLDAVAIFAYLIGIVWIGIAYAQKKRVTSEGYFLAGKSLDWKVIGASLFASNISTVHLVGLAESGFKDGILWGNFEWFSTVELLILAFVFVPFFLKSKVVTLPEFLEKRYDSRSRMILALFSILAALFMHIGISFYAGAVVFEAIFGWNIWFSVCLIAVATGLYTIIGGLSSVVLTESIQTVILILGSLLITLLALFALPEVGIHSFAELKTAVTPDRLSAVNFDSAAKGFSFRDMLFSHLILGIWYWCTDQTIVQRILGAKDENQARLGAVFAGFLKILPPFIMILPGILAFALFRSEIGEDTKSVLPVLIMELLPIGLKGLMVAALLAAVMSSVAAALTSCSTLVVYDVFDRLKPGLTDGKKIRIGRITAGLVLVLAVIWSPFLGNLGAIFELINQMFSIFAPSIVVVFLFGIVSSRGTSQASFLTLLLGSGIAAGVFLTEKYLTVNGVRNFVSSAEGLGINWMSQTVYFFLLSTAIYWATSALGAKPALNVQVSSLSFSGSSRIVIGLSALLMACMSVVYFFFF
jgi:SSS family solute:Na+ symporter